MSISGFNKARPLNNSQFQLFPFVIFEAWEKISKTDLFLTKIHIIPMFFASKENPNGSFQTLNAIMPLTAFEKH